MVKLPHMTIHRLRMAFNLFDIVDLVEFEAYDFGIKELPGNAELDLKEQLTIEGINFSEIKRTNTSILVRR